ncbi:MAG: 50S ribosomal protein L24 [Gemmatimonadota bacterium]|nr:50S ribosomal protein L24 [Gemmatimonadota bacterium]
MKIRKGDRVRVLRGNERGKEGTVIRVDSEKNRVVVEGVNIRKRHRKPSAIDPEGGIRSFEAPVHSSNVMLLDPGTGEPTRVRLQRNDKGQAERISAKSGRIIPKTTN